MAPMSREMSGLILPYDHFGSHLNDSAVTIDKELELKNLAYAAKTLGEVLSKVVIDGCEVFAEYVDAKGIADIPNLVSQEWYDLHVRESQYFLQIVKCSNRNCCGDWRSNIKDILSISNGFLPPPFPLRRAEYGSLFITNPEETREDNSFCNLFLRECIGLKPTTANGLPVCYDFYCPSVHGEITGQ